MRSGKYFFGFLASCARVLLVTINRLFRQAQALGFPVVPEVYIRTATSLRVPFAQGVTTLGGGSSFRFTKTAPEGYGEGASWNDDRLMAKCFKSLLINLARSKVEIMVLAVDISKQCFNVSSETKLADVNRE